MHGSGRRGGNDNTHVIHDDDDRVAEEKKYIIIIIMPNSSYDDDYYMTCLFLSRMKIIANASHVCNNIILFLVRHLATSAPLV